MTIVINSFSSDILCSIIYLLSGIYTSHEKRDGEGCRSQKSHGLYLSALNRKYYIEAAFGKTCKALKFTRLHLLKRGLFWARKLKRGSSGLANEEKALRYRRV